MEYELRRQLIYRERDCDWRDKHDIIFYITLVMFMLTCSFFLSFLVLFVGFFSTLRYD